MSFSRQPFSRTDNDAMQRRVRDAKLIHAFILFLVLILGLLMMTMRKYRRDVDMAWLFVGVIAVISSLFLIPGYLRLFRDQREQLKICGEFPIEKVVEPAKYSTHFYLKVEVDGKGHKLRVSQDIYDRILPREKLYVEFAPHSNTVFKIVKNGVELPV